MANKNLSTPYSDALKRAVGSGTGAGANLGAYKDASGKITTYRPEFSGQTVQMGNQYITYNGNGYPTKATSVSHAQSLGNDYTTKNMGLDQTKISNAADIYRGMYNATMQNPSTVSGSALDTAYGKRNIQFGADYSVQDYDKLIRDASSQGSNVLAGMYEDSRNALITDRGFSPSLQTSTYNGAWNYVDNGGGIGSLSSKQKSQDLNGWYAGQGKGDAGEYFYRNYDAPTMPKVLSYAAALGYDVEGEKEALPLGSLARQMMSGGYVSPETLQKAETLKTTVPAALKNLGIESDRTGTEALDMAIRSMQSMSSETPYADALKAVEKVSYGTAVSGNPESQWMDLYDDSYSAALRQLKTLTDAKTRQTTSAYDAEKSKVNRSYADMFRQLYIDREQSKKNLAQQMAAYGMTGGASESAILGLDTDYQEALRQGEQSRIEAISNLEQAILQAQLSGDISYAQQALQMEQDRINNYASMLKTLMNRQDSQREQQYDREMDKAKLLASIGDFSGYKALGLTDEQIAALNRAYAAQRR